MKTGQASPPSPAKPAERNGLTVYKSKKYGFGFIHIIRARKAYGGKVISVSIRTKGADGVDRANQSLTMTLPRWREILPVLAEELKAEEAAQQAKADRERRPTHWND